MAVPKVSVEIEYIPQENNISGVNFGDTFDRVSGVQDSTYPNTLSTISSGSNPFVLGKSILGTGAIYMSEYDGYYSSVASGSDFYDATNQSKGYKIGENGLTITISRNDGQPITQLCLFFDSIVAEYPVIIEINNQQYINNSFEFDWIDTTYNSSTLTVSLLSWNVANSAIKITGLIDGLTKTYDRTNNLAELSIKIQSTSSNLPEYGCIARNDNIVLKDYNYEIQNYGNYGILKKDLPVTIYIGDKTEENIVGFYKTTNEWILSDEQTISITIADEISKWDSIYMKFKRGQRFTNALSCFQYVLSDVIGLNFSEDIIISDVVKNVLANITFGYLPLYLIYSEQVSARQFLDDLCVLTQCYIYTGKQNKIIISRIVNDYDSN